jgi:hypothetical protein
MALRTRKPTGKAPWPMLLLAGVEKSGKSYACAALSASDLIDRTFYIEVGEGSADQYGALPGARYEIVEHDGSHQGILAACEAAVAEPMTNGRPHCIIFDSASEYWALLGDEQASIAAKRGKETITMDQWNSAKKRWRKTIDALRSSKGPVILTSRLDLVTVMDKAGKPTTEKQWKVRAEKDLPYEVDGVIELKTARKPVVTGIRTVAFNVPAGGIVPKDQAAFNLDGFLRSLNIDGGDRVYIPRKEDPNAYREDKVADDTLDALKAQAHMLDAEVIPNA